MQNPNYGGPPGSAVGKSSIGLDGNVAAAIGYIVGLLALVLIFIEKDNRFVRFHAIQSVLYAALATVTFVVLSIVLTVISIALAFASETLAAISGLLWTLLFLLLVLAHLGCLIYAAVKSYQGQTFKLPIVGSLAEKFTK